MISDKCSALPFSYFMSKKWPRKVTSKEIIEYNGGKYRSGFVVNFCIKKVDRKLLHFCKKSFLANQCWGSGSKAGSGSAYFWASRIRIH
jgi:hypothetical protein